MTIAPLGPANMPWAFRFYPLRERAYQASLTKRDSLTNDPIATIREYVTHGDYGMHCCFEFSYQPRGCRDWQSYRYTYSIPLRDLIEGFDSYAPPLPRVTMPITTAAFPTDVTVPAPPYARWMRPLRDHRSIAHRIDDALLDVWKAKRKAWIGAIVMSRGTLYDMICDDERRWHMYGSPRLPSNMYRTQFRYHGITIAHDDRHSMTGFRIMIECDMCKPLYDLSIKVIPSTMTCDARTGKCSKCAGTRLIIGYQSPDWKDAP